MADLPVFCHQHACCAGLPGIPPCSAHPPRQPLAPIHCSPPGEDDAALLSRALASLGTAAEAGEAPPQAAALLQRLSSLVQAGLPMPKRGAFWRLFLNVAGKRREGEYARLIAEVEELEQMGSAAVSPAAAPTASKAKASGSAYSMVADASSGAASAAAAAAKSAAAALRRIDTFTLTPLDCDETPNCTPSKPAGSGEASGQAAATAPPLALPGDAPLAGGSAAALGTPASTLQTPLSTTSSSSGGSGSGDPGAAPTPSSTADAGAGDGACSSKGGPGDPAARTAERWRQQDYMSQVGWWAGGGQAGAGCVAAFLFSCFLVTRAACNRTAAQPKEYKCSSAPAPLPPIPDPHCTVCPSLHSTYTPLPDRQGPAPHLPRPPLHGRRGARDAAPHLVGLRTPQHVGGLLPGGLPVWCLFGACLLEMPSMCMDGGQHSTASWLPGGYSPPMGLSLSLCIP